MRGVRVGDEVRPKGLLYGEGTVVIAAEPITHKVGITRGGDVGTVRVDPGQFVCTLEAPDGFRFAGIVLERRDIIPQRVLLLRR